MLILGIESTCDETAAAIVRDGREILSNVVFSQADMHAVYGGVIPELACRRHLDAIIPVIQKACEEANVPLEAIDKIAVAKGPGLIGALLVGINAAKTLAYTLSKPLIPINHIEAHLYAAMMQQDNLEFPLLGLIVSGGHTSLLLVEGIGKYTAIGQTTDDAVGEAFDKVAKMLSLPYPGGPEVEKLAKGGDAYAFPFKGGNVKGKEFHFSFSGLKTAVLYAIRGQNEKGAEPLTEKTKSDIAASFQRAAFDDLIQKSRRALDKFGCRGIVFGGGVSNSRTLRAMMQNHFEGVSLYWPAGQLSLDNAAMIAALAYHKEPEDLFSLTASTRISW
jgi:N6-L-threonylcarbamoyladenine synthase